MWAAIQSDLLDFVHTIKEDATKVINKATGEKDEEEEVLSMREKLVQDVKRSFDTYGTPLDEQHVKEFEKYMRQFSLSSQAADIAQLLDDEPDVSRYYAELVPAQISPDLFWARYFFRLLLVSRGGVVDLDEDEEEEAWESSVSSEAVAGKAASPSSSGAGEGSAAVQQLTLRVRELEQENAQLKGHIKVLVGRINTLEAREVPVASSPADDSFEGLVVVSPPPSAADPLPLSLPATPVVLQAPPPPKEEEAAPAAPAGSLASLEDDEEEAWG
jgi:hypothetical protein